VIACANRDLPTEVAEGRFRADLFYRLNVFPLALAPLHERREDIAPLAFALVLRHCAPGKALPWISDAALAMLKLHSWPGNVRELENVIRRALLLADGLAMTGPSNTIADLVPGLNLSLTGTNIGAPTTIRFSDPGAGLSTFMNDLVGALNELAGELKTQTDPLSGDLARDGGARAMRHAFSQLAGSIVIPGAAVGDPATLADLGLATNRDGTFRLDTDRLSATLKAAPEGAAAMFTTGLHGVYATFDKLSRRLTAASDPGTLSGSLPRLTAQKRRSWPRRRRNCGRG
jgi:flagellar hook-associated protein 2